MHAHSQSRRAAVLGALVATCALLGARAFAQSATCGSLMGTWPRQLLCFQPDLPARADEVNANLRTVWNSVVPVGAIIAWHKSLPGTPALPANYVECNGQSITDPDSPYMGATAPNLNASGRFLRGSATSGNNQGDTLQAHSHDLNAGSTIHLLNRVHPMGSFELFGSDQRACTGASGCSSGYYDEYAVAAPSVSDPTQSSGGIPRVSVETRPINMSVVWVMRIK